MEAFALANECQVRGGPLDRGEMRVLLSVSCSCCACPNDTVFLTDTGCGESGMRIIRAPTAASELFDYGQGKIKRCENGLSNAFAATS